MAVVNFASQLEFIAEDEMIEIVPNLNMGPLNMICVRIWLIILGCFKVQTSKRISR